MKGSKLADVSDAVNRGKSPASAAVDGFGKFEIIVIALFAVIIAYKQCVRVNGIKRRVLADVSGRINKRYFHARRRGKYSVI